MSKPRPTIAENNIPDKVAFDKKTAKGNMQNMPIQFEKINIRRAWHHGEWWFVVEDIVSAVTQSKDPKSYLNKIKQRDPDLSKGYGQFVHTLDVPTTGGKQKMSCSNLAGCFRIIQSIRSAKAEPFKIWLAERGAESIKDAKIHYLDEREKYAQRLKEENHMLAGAAKGKGVKNFATFVDVGNRGFYNKLTTNQLKDKKGIPRAATIPSRLGRDELAAQEFAKILSRRSIESMDKSGERAATLLNYEAHKQVREDLIKYGGVAPEDMPAEPDISIARKLIEEPHIAQCIATQSANGGKVLEIYLPSGVTEEQEAKAIQLMRDNTGEASVLIYRPDGRVVTSSKTHVSTGLKFKKELSKILSIDADIKAIKK